ncbi:Uncharacterised protein [uncultured archaeon]|nr:Uncharacterised protein [uncultured archaeon]
MKSKFLLVIIFGLSLAAFAQQTKIDPLQQIQWSNLGWNVGSSGINTMTIGSGNNLQLLPSPTQEGFGAGTFTPSANNPINTYVKWHGHLFVNADGSCDYYFYNGAGTPEGYTYATDSMCEDWGPIEHLTGDVPNYSWYSDVFQVGSIRYLIMSDSSNGYQAKHYMLYASTNSGDGQGAGTWTIQNGGNPVFTASSTSTAWDYYVYNPAVWVNGSTWVLFVDGQSTSGVGVATATGCPNSCTFTATSTYIVGNTTGTGGSNPFIVPVPDKNAIVVGLAVAGTGGILFYTMPTADDPTLTTSYTLAPGAYLFNPTSITTHTGASDGTMAFSPKLGLKSWNGIMGYSYQQSVNYQAYTNLTVDQWYNAITDPVGYPYPYINQPQINYNTGNWIFLSSSSSTSMVAGLKVGTASSQGSELFGYISSVSGTIQWEDGMITAGDYEVLDIPHSYFQRLDFINGSTNKFNSYGSGANVFNSQPGAGTGGAQFYSGGATTSVDVLNIDQYGALLPKVVYSAAGTILPTCSSTYNGAELTVSDATTPTYMGTYVSGGAITAKVICSYNGTTYSWLTH